MDLKLLYGENADLIKAQKRIDDLKQTFIKSEGFAPSYTFSSSGRAEILGNHTDHNHGLVMVASISCDVLAVVSPREDNVIKICSLGYPDVVVNILDLEIKSTRFQNLSI